MIHHVAGTCTGGLARARARMRLHERTALSRVTLRCGLRQLRCFRRLRSANPGRAHLRRVNLRSPRRGRARRVIGGTTLRRSHHQRRRNEEKDNLHSRYAQHTPADTKPLVSANGYPDYPRSTIKNPVSTRPAEIRFQITRAFPVASACPNSTTCPGSKLDSA